MNDDSVYEGIISQGKFIGSGGAAFRTSSRSGASGKHEHGLDIGAKRNSEHEKTAADRATSNIEKREKEIQKRNNDAAARRKETLKMAKDKSINEGSFSKHETDHLKQMHTRDVGVISRYKGKMGAGIDDVIDREHSIRKELIKRGHSVEKPKHKLVIEAEVSRGTEARTKIKNVARQDDSAPMSEKSTLNTTNQIKSKKIDEGKPFMSDRNFGLPASVINAVRQIIEKKNDDNSGDPKKMSGGKTQVDLEPSTNDRIDEGEPKKNHTTPKTPKEKKLAALASPKNKITHKDVLVGRGVVKEEDVLVEGVKSGNEFRGYHGEAYLSRLRTNGGSHKPNLRGGVDYQAIKKSADQADRDYSSAHTKVKKHAGEAGLLMDVSKPNVMIKHYLDSVHGRHIHGSIDDHKAVSRDFAKFKKKYNPEHFKEDFAFSQEEIERLDEIAVALEEAKKAKSSTTTVTSAPVRGSNQDQSGFRSKGNVADYTISDETQQVSEVSKKTLASYITKASQDVKKRAENEGQVINGKREVLLSKKFSDYAEKTRKRTDNIAKAAHKLAKEEVELENLEEVSDKTLKSYIGKAKTDRENLRKTFTKQQKSGPEIFKGKSEYDSYVGNSGKSNSYFEKKIKNRKAGVRLATNKLTREEVEQIDEAKPTPESPYDSAYKEAKGHVNKIYHKTLKHALDKMKAGHDEADTFSKIHLGAGHHAAKKILNKHKIQTESLDLEEGRGRPRKNPLPDGKETEGDDTHKHPMQQLEKISMAMQGNEPHFEHKDGSKTKISKQLARHIVSAHNSLRTSQEKDEFAKKLHANRDSMRSAMEKHF